MSQMTFDDSFDQEKATESVRHVKSDLAESWYKGRILSHSSISTYQSCPQKWKFRYIDKIPQKPRSYFSFGKSVHSGLEFLYSKGQENLPSLDEMLDHYKKLWLSEGYESPQQEKWFFNEGNRILKGFYVKHKNDSKKVFQVELKFTLQIDGVPVTGFIDRIDHASGGTLNIIDYKTGKSFDKSRVRSDPQLTLYQVAVETLLNKKVENVTLYHLNSLTPVTLPAHSAHLISKLKEGISEAAHGINDQKYDPKPDENGQCRWCDYLQICPAFSGGKKSVGLAEDVDRFGKLDQKIKKLESERDEIGQTLKYHLKSQKENRIEGEHFAVSDNGDDLSVEPLDD